MDELTVAKAAKAKGYPQIKAAALNAYIAGVSFEKGKTITAAHAAILISQASQL